jgi:DNA-binding CsgD family transcriptional regulator
MAEPNEPLTERELEVVRLLATGVSNKEIAAQLRVSPNTVRVHLSNITTKLQAQSRTEIAMIAVRNGWVERRQEVAHQAGGSQVGSEDTADATMPTAAPQPLPPEPVPVAPNPEPPPPLAMWRRIASVAALIIALALTIPALQRSAPQTAAELSGSLLVDGTFGPAIEAPPNEATRWYPRASIRTARSRMAVTPVAGKVYVIGGEVDRAASSEVVIYDPERDAWSDGGRKPTPVMNTGAAAIGNRIYVPGGTTPSAIATDRMEVFDTQSNEWKVAPALPRPLTGHGVAAFNGRVYVVGGRTINGINAETYVFDPASGQWSSLAPLPTPRTQLGVAVSGGRLYAVGGYDGQREYTTCEFLHIDEGRWYPCAPMTIPRGSLGLAPVGAALFAIGGGLTGYIGFNERYDPGSDRWVPFEMPLPRLGDWRGMGLAAMATQFYAVGGTTRGVPLSDSFVYEVLNNRTFLPAFQSGGER